MQYQLLHKTTCFYFTHAAEIKVKRGWTFCQSLASSVKCGRITATHFILFFFVFIFDIILLLLIKILFEEILYSDWITNQISQDFGKNPQKRDLRDGSKTGDDDSKKPRESSSGSYTEEVDVFEESAESADCRKVLFNCLKNLEQKKNDLY